MGVIRSQSIYSTVYSYIGVVIGFVTSALIMPKLMMPGQIGFIKLIIAVTGVFSTIFSLGVGQLLFRSFPNFEDNKAKRRKLLWLSLKIGVFGSVLSIPVFYFTSPSLFNFDITTAGIDKNTQLLILIFFVIVSRIVYTSIYSYVRMMNNIVVDAFIKNIFQKVGVFILLAAFYFKMIGFSEFVYLYLIIYLLFPFVLVFYFSLKKDSLSIRNYSVLGISKNGFSKTEKREFRRLLLFGVLTTLGGSLYLYLDTLMINFYLTEAGVGIYGTMFLFGVIVIVPARSVKSISVSVLARSIKEKDFENVHDIYRKSSITLLIIGGYIFMGVWCNMSSVFEFLPADYELGAYVVLCIGVGQLFDMATGTNSEIIAVSPHYRLNTLFTISSIVVGVISNIIFIPLYGIQGAGIATMLTILFINVLRLLAVYRYYKIQPFTKNTAVLVLIITCLTIVVQIIPSIDNYLLNLLFKGTLITVVYIPLVIKLKLSADFNDMVFGVLRRITRTKKK